MHFKLLKKKNRFYEFRQTPPPFVNFIHKNPFFFNWWLPLLSFLDTTGRVHELLCTCPQYGDTSYHIHKFSKMVFNIILAPYQISYFVDILISGRPRRIHHFYFGIIFGLWYGSPFHPTPQHAHMTGMVALLSFTGQLEEHVDVRSGLKMHI